MTRHHKTRSEAAPDRAIERRVFIASHALPSADELAQQLVQHFNMKETADYLMRGRRFARLDLDDLNKEWVAAFLAVYERYERQTDLQDTSAEFGLRGLEPPYGSVQELMDRFVEKLKRLGPERASNPGVRQKIREFMEERNKPYH
jgi:hypothetical protein